MSCIPFWKGCNKNIEYVDRSHRGLDHVPEGLQRYSRSLEELILDTNHIKELPKGFYRLSQLRKLNLSDNQISKLSPDIGNFVHLAELDLSKNELSQIPETIKLCKCLQMIDFSCNPLEILPSGISDLKTLTRLCLNDIRLSVLPAAIGNLTNLETLELRDNAIDTLPAAVSCLTLLRTLDLGGNMLDAVPEFIGCLYSLEELRMDCNDISYVPSEIGKLKKLTQLDLSENCVEQIPCELGELICLTDLLLSFNRIEQLPDGIGNLRKLCTLKLDMNLLDKLPSLIGSCHALQELILTENQLTEIPSTIGRLKSLVILNADRNRLTCLPVEIGCCNRLSVLSVRDNSITCVPSEIGNLRQLHVLDVSRNCLRNLPLSLSLCDLKAIWLSENQAQPLLSFQQDIDEETGEKVLTCFLLPQAGCIQTSENAPSPTGAAQSISSSVTDVHQPSHSSVKFVDEEQVEHREGQCHLVRQSTPHPKELRARHSRLPSVDRGSSRPDVIGSNPDVACSDVSSELLRVVEADKPHFPCRTPTKSKRRLTTPTPLVVMDEFDMVSKTSSHVSLAMSLLSDTNTGLVDVIFGYECSIKRVTGSDTFMSSTQVLKSYYLDMNMHEKSDILGVSVVLESSATYDTARENFSDDTLTASDSSSILNNTFDLLDGFKYKTNSCNSSTSELNIMSVPPSIQTVIRVIRKAGTALGISIAGGRGSMPFIGHDDGIFISRVTPEGACDRAGVELGDRLMSVNGESLVDATHRRAVHVLKHAGDDILLIVIKASVSNINQEEIASRTNFNPSSCDQYDVSEDDTLRPNRRKRSTRKKVSSDVNSNSVELDIQTVRQDDKQRDQWNDSIITPSSVDDSFQSACAVWQCDGGGQCDEIDDFISPNENDDDGDTPDDDGDRDDVDTPDDDDARPVDSRCSAIDDIILDGSEPVEYCFAERNRMLSESVPLNGSHKDFDDRPSEIDLGSASKYRSKDIDVPLDDTSVDSSAVNDIRSRDTIRLGTESNGLHLIDVGIGNNNNSHICLSDVELNGNDVDSNSSTVYSFHAFNDSLSESAASDWNLDRELSMYLVETIVINKTGGTLGISIVGGQGQTSHPYGVNEPGIFVSKIQPNSPAAKTSLRVGDRILSVNGKDIQTATHQEAVSALVVPKRRLRLAVRHDPLPAGFQEIRLELSAGDMLGINIQGGYGSVCGNRYDETDEGIFISKIAKNSAAARDGRLVVGHRLLEVNGCCLLGASHAEALAALVCSDTCADLTISDGYNNIKRKYSSSMRSRHSSTRSLTSISSINASEPSAGGSLNRNRRVRVRRVKHDKVNGTPGDDLEYLNESKTVEQLEPNVDEDSSQLLQQQERTSQQLIRR